MKCSYCKQCGHSKDTCTMKKLSVVLINEFGQLSTNQTPGQMIPKLPIWTPSPDQMIPRPPMCSPPVKRRPVDPVWTPSPSPPSFSPPIRRRPNVTLFMTPNKENIN